MKIQKLNIDSYRHLENLHFDFTYPKGHSKAGQPLEKICLIGQSATGKTSVLEYIKEIITDLIQSSIPTLKNMVEDPDTLIRDINGVAEFILNDDIIRYKGNKLTSFATPLATQFELLLRIGLSIKVPTLLYFTAELLSQNNFNVFALNPVNSDPQLKNIHTPDELLQIKNNNRSKFAKIIKQPVLEFNGETNNLLWLYILDEISIYLQKVLQKGSELINTGKNADYNILKSEMDEWKISNPNPLIELADKCLNPILKKLNLEVNIIETSSFIPIKQINSDKQIPAFGLSTGTKQLLLNSLPIFKLDTKNSIIMIDEPERSLYPDIQIELMSYYKNIAPEAQFIVATHSPFIAAAFEPEERFILYFDHEGKVQVRNGVSPIGDDPNDILKNDFGIESLMNSFGVQAYKNYVELKQKLEQEKEPVKKKELLKEAVLLGDKYKF